jgi:hypothetical protein
MCILVVSGLVVQSPAVLIMSFQQVESIGTGLGGLALGNLDCRMGSPSMLLSFRPESLSPDVVNRNAGAGDSALLPSGVIGNAGIAAAIFKFADVCQRQR